MSPKKWAIVFLCFWVGSTSLGGSLGCGLMPKIRILHDPLSAHEHLTLGMSYETQGKMDLAISEYRAAYKKGSEELGVTPVIHLANAYAIQGDLKKAGKYYREALARDPGNGPVLNNLAWVYLQEGVRLQEAEELVRQALDQNAPGADPRARHQRAMVLDTYAEIKMARGWFSEALDLLLEAQDLADREDPSFLSHLYLNLGRAYEAVGQTEQAHESRRKARTPREEIR